MKGFVASPPVVPASTTVAKRPPLSPATPAFRWSWKLVTLAGIDIYIHGTFLLLIAFVAVSGVVSGRAATAVVSGTLLILAVFATVVLHELGHALMARRFGVRTRDITLLPIGGVARLESMPDKPVQQLLVSLAGPSVNLLIAVVLFCVVYLLGLPVAPSNARLIGAPFLSQLMWINVSLAAFNLLPGYPMDGGRVLRALLAMRLAPEQATQIAARIGQGVAVLFGVAGLFGNPLLVVIAVFVWLGAKAEYSASTVRLALAGISVRQAMITEFRTLSPDEPLWRAVDFTRTGFQQDFPVMDGPRLVGVVMHGDVLKGVADQRLNLPVRQAMRAEFATASPTEPLDRALTRMHQGECRVLAVMDDQHLIGLLTVENIGELLALEAAGHRRGSGP